MNNIYKIYSYIGGSHAYGLNNEESDIDERGVFLNNEPSKIFGLEPHEHQEDKETDTFYFELRRFLKLAKKGNTQILEALFNNVYLSITEAFKTIRAVRDDLLDSEVIYKTLRGYAQGEKNIIIGHNSGKLGEKRKSAIERYGYSYRNAVHCLRLLRCGVIFFEKNVYPVNIVEMDSVLGVYIKDIKNNPQNHNVDEIINEINVQDGILEKSFKNRSKDYKFNMSMAAEICRYCYKYYLYPNS